MFEQPGVNPAIALAHGAFTDASRWNGVIERLRQQGYTVVVPAIPASTRIALSRAAAAHNLPREAPQALAQAVIAVNGCRPVKITPQRAGRGRLRMAGTA